MDSLSDIVAYTAALDAYTAALDEATLDESVNGKPASPSSPGPQAEHTPATATGASATPATTTTTTTTTTTSPAGPTTTTTTTTTTTALPTHLAPPQEQAGTPLAASSHQAHAAVAAPPVPRTEVPIQPPPPPPPPPEPEWQPERASQPTQGFSETLEPPTSRGIEPMPPLRRGPLAVGLGVLLLLTGFAALGWGLYMHFGNTMAAQAAQEQLVDDFETRKALASGGELTQPFDRDARVDDTTPPVAQEDFSELDDVPVIFDADDTLVTDPVEDPGILIENPGAHGDPVGRILIPQIGVDWVVVHGVNPEDLVKGPGHMPRTPLPGQPGNAVISGHRTTYGAPFNRLDELNEGDRFTVETLIGTHTYEVVEVIIVAPTDVWVVQPRDGAWLTLTTCHPKGSARQRLIVISQLVDGPNISQIIDSDSV